MTEVIWKNDYCIGIETIDTQHKKLFDLLNQLYIESEKDSDISDIIEIFNELQSYTKYHFSEEEKYFTSLPDDEREAHIKEHEYFIEELDDSIQQSIRIGTLSLNLIYFLNDWLINHIQVVDKEYV